MKLLLKVIPGFQRLQTPPQTQPQLGPSQLDIVVNDIVSEADTVVENQLDTNNEHDGFGMVETFQTHQSHDCDTKSEQSSEDLESNLNSQLLSGLEQRRFLREAYVKKRQKSM